MMLIVSVYLPIMPKPLLSVINYKVLYVGDLLEKYNVLCNNLVLLGLNLPW